MAGGIQMPWRDVNMLRRGVRQVKEGRLQRSLLLGGVDLVLLADSDGVHALVSAGGCIGHERTRASRNMRHAWAVQERLGHPRHTQVTPMLHPYIHATFMLHPATPTPHPYQIHVTPMPLCHTHATLMPPMPDACLMGDLAEGLTRGSSDVL